MDVSGDFLGVQFLLQEQENDDFETINLATTFEWQPNDNLKFHLDYVLNDQERSRDQFRLQAAGVSAALNTNVPSSVESVDFGNGLVVDSPDDLDAVGVLVSGITPSDLSSAPLGVFQRATTGNIIPFLSDDDDDPNLRFTTETNSRVTESEILVLGGDWESGKWTIGAEIALTDSETVTPTLNTTLNFINPACPPDGSSNDNCVPFVFDLTGGQLAFDVLTADRALEQGLDPVAVFAPTEADLTNPENVVLDAISQDLDTTDNSEDAFRLDLSYAFADEGITSVDFGYRYNKTESTFRNVGDSFGFSALEDSPNGLLFEELLVVGPTNFDDADGRDLFIENFLLIDPDRSFSDPEGVLDILENALAEQRLLNPTADGSLGVDPQFNPLESYEVEEETDAVYAQLNFSKGIFRGNLGFRYVDTDFEQTSAGAVVLGTDQAVLETTSNSYDFFLPRLNIVAQVADDVVVRFGYGSDIQRPDFDDVTSGLDFDDGENDVVNFGNPDLVPEEVDSLDLSVEWYFAPESVVSLGYFRKERTDIFGTFTNGAVLIPDDTTTSGFARETDINCPGGGIFNPNVEPNVLGDENIEGLCVNQTFPENDSGRTTQTGFEFAFQYNLGGFEDALGWASGFGVIANYTSQRFSGGDIVDVSFGRGASILGDNVAIPRGLLDFSEEAFNFTLYYEKYGLSARARYTWRDDFRTQDFGGGANESGSSTFSFPVIQESRGQLNLSVNYDITDSLNVGVEVVNATQEDITQRCVSDTGPVCFEGFPDRRITFGASYRF